MKIKTQWGVIAYDPQAIACDADIVEMADAAFGEHAGEWLVTRTGYRPGMTCAEAWEMIAARAIYHDYIGANCPNPAGCYAMGECAMRGGCGILPATKPDDDVMNTPCPECNPQPLP